MRVEQVNVATPAANSRMPLVTTSTPLAWSRVMAAWTCDGSASNSIRDRFTA